MILPILTEPNPLLHQPAELITEITPEIRQLVSDMRETMHNAQGIGLAAPQVGQLLSVCIIELNDPEQPEYDLPYTVLINPRITWSAPRKCTLSEACLSIPGLEGDVNRPEKVRVKARNLDNQVFELEAEGLMARALQHEIDHLKGILFTSYVPKKKLVNRPLVDYPRI